MRVRGDPWAAVVLHLRHVTDCSAAQAREQYYDELGGEQCCQFLRTKERQEYDKHKNTGRSGGADGKRVGKPPYQFPAIYEIVSIKRVYGGMNAADPHAATYSTEVSHAPTADVGAERDDIAVLADKEEEAQEAQEAQEEEEEEEEAEEEEVVVEEEEEEEEEVAPGSTQEHSGALQEHSRSTQEHSRSTHEHSRSTQVLSGALQEHSRCSREHSGALRSNQEHSGAPGSTTIYQRRGLSHA